MVEDEQEAFGRLLTDVMKYYRSPPTQFLLDVWWKGCRRFPLDSVSRALHAHIADPERGQFAPKLADVVRHLAGTASDRAAVAWGKVYDAMKSVGAWQDVAFDDPVIHAAINDMGGWPRVARVDNNELPHTQYRFLETYKSLADRGVAGYPRVLAGARDSDEEYERKGLPLPAPVLVGDAVQAALVVKNGGAPRVPMTFLPAGALLDRLPGGISLRALPAPGAGDA